LAGGQGHLLLLPLLGNWEGILPWRVIGAGPEKAAELPVGRGMLGWLFSEEEAPAGVVFYGESERIDGWNLPF